MGTTGTSLVSAATLQAKNHFEDPIGTSALLYDSRIPQGSNNL